jgi:hypothetical protein
MPEFSEQTEVQKRRVVLDGEELLKLIRSGWVEDDNCIVAVPKEEWMPVVAEITDA